MAINNSGRAGTHADLKNKLATTSQAAASARAPSTDPISVFLEKNKAEIAKALPRTGMTVERLARVALTTIRTTPKLMSCDRMSLMAAIMLSAQLGLEPGGPLGQAYIIPYGNEAQFQLGYRGCIELMWRSDTLQSLAVHEVCEHDEFEFEYGLNETLRHKPAMKGERGPAYGYYLVAHYKHGGHFIYWMSRDDVERIRKFSKVPNSPAWRDHYDAMARKTVVKQAARWMPLSIEVAQAIAQDETVRRGFDEDMTLVPAEDTIEGTGVTIDAEPTGDDPRRRIVPTGNATFDVDAALAEAEAEHRGQGGGERP